MVKIMSLTSLFFTLYPCKTIIETVPSSSSCHEVRCIHLRVCRMSCLKIQILVDISGCIKYTSKNACFAFHNRKIMKCLYQESVSECTLKLCVFGFDFFLYM